MKLLIVTHTPHWVAGSAHFAYGPYVREMNLWTKYASETVVVAPLAKNSKTDIHWQYDSAITLKKVAGFSFVSFRESVSSLFNIPFICYQLYSEMRKADHIHLRCPGNMGLLGCFVQLFFPKKKKTAKYAGNWDPQSKQPTSYKLQKQILSNTSITKNMQALVYGDWNNATNNIKSFFTASYPDTLKANYNKEIGNQWRFMFVGSLVSGKRPSYAIDLIKELNNRKLNAILDIYGDGIEREGLENNGLPFIKFYGNQSAEVLIEAYKKSHFILLPSKSEGWPKAIAEGMFFGAIPIVSSVSCTPWMLDVGKRGILLSLNLEHDVINIKSLMANALQYQELSAAAQKWSQEYTLDSFENAIKKLLV